MPKFTELDMTDNLQGLWRVHTPNLLKELANNSKDSGIMQRPLQIFGDLLYQVGVRASKLNDPELNTLMLRLTIYGEADPEDPNYNPELLNDILYKKTINSDERQD